MGINIKNKTINNIKNSVSSNNFQGFEYKTEDMLVPAKIWIPEDIFFSTEDETIKQIRNMGKIPVIYDHIVVTPDAHAGYGVCIGGVMALKDAVSPGGVGKDCGCGMLAVKTNIFEKDFLKKREKVMDELYDTIPVGFAWQQQKQDISSLDASIVKELSWAQNKFKDSNEDYINMIPLFLGTLGGGNHFWESQIDENEQIWIMIHSGSRNLGQQIADYYEKIAIEDLEQKGIILPDNGLAYLDINTLEGQEYLHSMNFALDFARLNRDNMLEKTISVFKNNFKNFQFDGEVINKHHNYAEKENYGGVDVIVHRKGAIKVEKGELGIIPGSMDTGSYIVEGLGNDDAFNSASHGAGRRMSRSQAAKTLDWDTVKENLIKRDVTIYKGGIGNLIKNWPENPHEKRFQRMMSDAISETEKGYKNIQKVLDWESDIVKPIVKLKPKATLKG